jgi:tRNA(Arg) A34 adenosine deaminase TadA
VVAIREACRILGDFQLTGCDIYTSCEPCPMCLAAIYWARPNRVFYANTKEDAANIDFDDQFIYEEIEKSPNQRSIPMYRVMGEQAIKAFEKWQTSVDKITY